MPHSNGLYLGGRICLSNSREPWTRHHLFALRAVAVAMRGDEKQPLIQVELAEYWMLKEVPPQICTRAGGKIQRLPACPFEFIP